MVNMITCECHKKVRVRLEIDDWDAYLSCVGVCGNKFSDLSE